MDPPDDGTGPGAGGPLLALLAAACFGASTPLIRLLGDGAGPWTTAGILYAGAAVVSLFQRRGAGREAPIRRRHLPRLFLVAVFGSMLAPAALAWGLRRTSALSASLLLNTEASLTILLARVLYREHVGRRVAAAACLLAVGGACLPLGDAAAGDAAGAAGLLAVLAAAGGWALDSAAARPLAELDPGQVVASKAAIGSTMSLAIGALAGEAVVGATTALGLAAVGGVGYGLGLRFFLLAQRSCGTARTASWFSSAPFLGALLAILLGDRPGPFTGAAALLALAGVALLASESHAHRHAHFPLDHEHAHRHDAGHHDHARDEGHATGAERHSHRHLHAPAAHAHPHGPDQHHDHAHRKP